MEPKQDKRRGKAPEPTPEPQATEEPKATEPIHYRFILTRPRYVAHTGKWTRNKPSGSMTIAVEGDSVILSRSYDSTESKTAPINVWGEEADGRDKQRPPVEVKGKHGVALRIPLTSVCGEDGAPSADALMLLLQRVIQATGYGVQTDAQRRAALVKASAISQRAIRDSVEPGLIGAMDALTTSADLAFTFATPNERTEGIAPCVATVARAKAQGLIPSAALLKRCVKAEEAGAVADVPEAAQALAEMIRAIRALIPQDVKATVKADEPKAQTEPDGASTVETVKASA